jgi:hypothetical protein
VHRVTGEEQYLQAAVRAMDNCSERAEARDAGLIWPVAAETEGLLLDPAYTGKAMPGLPDHARRGIIPPDSTVIFLHTGGLPGLFAYGREVEQALVES